MAQTVDTDALVDVYVKNFDPVKYARMYTSDLYTEEPVKASNLFRQQIILAHNIFKEGHIKGETMLDFACGSSILMSIIPSMYYKEVYYSDLVSGCREFIRDWWQEKPGAHDFQNCFDFAATVTGRRTPWKEGPAILRSKVKGIFSCNIHDPDLLEKSAPRQFDLVTNSLMLDEAFITEKEVPAAIQRLASLVKPKGHLVIYKTFNPESKDDFYVVEETKFPLAINKSETLKAAMNTNGLKLLYWYEQTDPIECQPVNGDVALYDTIVYAVAYKE